MSTASALAVPDKRNVPESGNAPEKRRDAMAAKIKRVRAVEEAGELIGKARLAAAVGLSDRALRAYAAFDRMMPDALLVEASRALEARAAEIQAHAQRMRELLAEAREERE